VYGAKIASAGAFGPRPQPDQCPTSPQLHTVAGRGFL